jgi:hypothetical protein
MSIFKSCACELGEGEFAEVFKCGILEILVTD